MKRYILCLMTLVSTSLYGMENTNFLKELAQHATENAEYNENYLPTKDALGIIFDYCKKVEGSGYEFSLKEVNNAYCQIKTLLALNITCKHFNTLMPFTEIVEFCRTLSMDTKDTLLQSAIGNIDQSWRKWAYPDAKNVSNPKDLYTNNLMCLALLQAGANPNITREIKNQKNYEKRTLSLLSQAMDTAPFLVVAALKRGANPNIKDFQGNPIFFYAKTVEMAKLFLEHNCNLHEKNRNNDNIVCHILSEEYHPKLLTFYLRNWVNIPYDAIHKLIKLLEKYVDNDSCSIFLEKCDILLGKIIEDSKNKICQNRTLLDELDLELARIETKKKYIPGFSELRDTAIQLFELHGCKTASIAAEEREIGDELNMYPLYDVEDKELVYDVDDKEQDTNLTRIGIVAHAYMLAQESSLLDKQDKDGNTLLILATMQRNTNAIKELLKSGADRSICNNDNLTAFDIAFESGDSDLADLLTEFEIEG